MLPAFPTSVFQPYEGVFRGGVIGRTKLVSKSSGSFFPLPWAWFDGRVQSSSNEFTIAYGRLIFLLFASNRLVAKTAHSASATQRLVHEYDAYAAMRSIQGAAIPNIIGMFGTKDGRNTVLIMSYAGKALKAFSELELHDKCNPTLPSRCKLTVILRLTLFHRLVRLHKTGVQHNDLEPRNVTKSSSGPFIIDFDRASLDHNCPGASCKELLQVAQALDLDLGE
jgi:serine/threonine protein kinase